VRQGSAELPQDIPIRLIAHAANTHFKVIKDLNPEVRGHYLTEGNHDLGIPKAVAKGFHGRYQDLIEKWLASREEVVYFVKKGDNLFLVGEKFGISLASLLIWNKLDPEAHIHPGDTLIIYKRKANALEAEEMMAEESP
jgi:membrane-bound lytic murein transglycosylase D